MSEFSNHIKKRRTAMHITVKDLAKSAGISAAYMYKIEAGDKRLPSLKVIRLIENELSFSPGFLSRTALHQKIMTIEHINVLSLPEKEILRTLIRTGHLIEDGAIAWLAKEVRKIEGNL